MAKATKKRTRKAAPKKRTRVADKAQRTKKPAKKVPTKKPLPKSVPKKRALSPQQKAANTRRLNEIAAIEKQIRRLRKQWEILDAELELALKRREAAAKGRETRAARLQEEYNRKQKRRQQRRLRTEERDEFTIPVEEGPFFTSFFLEQLTQKQITDLVHSNQQDGIGDVRIIVEVPATPDYPGGLKTRNLGFQKLSYETIRKIIGSMMIPGGEVIHKMMIETSQLDKLGEENKALLQAGRIAISDEEKERRAQSRRESLSHTKQKQKRHDRREGEKAEFDKEHIFKMNALKYRIGDLENKIAAIRSKLK